MSVAPKPLIVIGAGGLAYDLLDCLAALAEWKVEGLIDRDPSRRGEFYRGTRVLGGVDLIPRLRDQGCHFFMAFSSPEHFFHRRDVAQRWEQEFPGMQFATVKDPAAFVSETASIGRGVFLARGAYVGAEAIVGDHSIVLFNTVVSRFSQVGRYSFISAGVNIVGRRRIDELCYVGARAVINADVGPDLLIAAGTIAKAPAKGPGILSNKTETQSVLYRDLRQLQVGMGAL